MVRPLHVVSGYPSTVFFSLVILLFSGVGVKLKVHTQQHGSARACPIFLCAASQAPRTTVVQTQKSQNVCHYFHTLERLHVYVTSARYFIP